MQRLPRMWRNWTLVVVVVIAGTFSLFIPLSACSSCSGAGKVTAMQSHPEAMGSAVSGSGSLVDVQCPACDGKSRVTLYHKLTWEPAALSRK